jgi:hypothetical protein
MNELIDAIRKLEKKVPKLNGNNDFWKGYKEAIDDLWSEVERLENEEEESA